MANGSNGSADGIEPIEFTSSIVALDTGLVVIGLFDGAPAACVALLKAWPLAAVDLAERIRRAVEEAPPGSLPELSQ